MTSFTQQDWYSHLDMWINTEEAPLCPPEYDPLSYTALERDGLFDSEHIIFEHCSRQQTLFTMIRESCLCRHRKIQSQTSAGRRMRLQVSCRLFRRVETDGLNYVNWRRNSTGCECENYVEPVLPDVISKSKYLTPAMRLPDLQVCIDTSTPEWRNRRYHHIEEILSPSGNIIRRWAGDNCADIPGGNYTLLRPSLCINPSNNHIHFDIRYPCSVLGKVNPQLMLQLCRAGLIISEDEELLDSTVSVYQLSGILPGCRRSVHENFTYRF